MPRLIVFANGIVPDLASARRLIQPGDVLFAVDGGTRHVLALGLLPAVVIGDLDSLEPDSRQILEAHGVEIRQHPRDKDETDLELTLRDARAGGYREIIILGALGGRLDQTLGNLALLTKPEWAVLDIRLDDGVEETLFTRSRCAVHGKPADIISLLPWGGEVTGVCTEGLRWPLYTETLFPDKTRGISNEMVSGDASISLETGLLLVVHRRQV
jgi:thiamine pyrophosphokinase